jgi:hypothetical protein
MLHPSKNQSRNPARRGRMLISATMPMTTICPKRCRPNSGPQNRLRRIDHRGAIRRRVAKKLVDQRNRAGQNLDVNQLRARSHAGRNPVVQNLAQSAVTNRALRLVRSLELNLDPSASHQRTAANPQPARPAISVTIAQANAAVRVRRAKIVLPKPNSLASSDHDLISLVRKHAQNNHAPNGQLAPSGPPAIVPPLPRAPSASISRRASAAPGPLPKSQSRKNPLRKSPPLAHLQPSRPASPRKNSPRQRPAPRSPRSPVWA